jgi:hypothetical protein
MESRRRDRQLRSGRPRGRARADHGRIAPVAPARSRGAAGAPKSASNPSPARSFTVPPNSSTTRTTRAIASATISCTSSGSSRSARAVEPTRSAKTAVTTFRSSCTAPDITGMFPQGFSEWRPLKENSPSRLRFRPPLRPTFRFHVQPPGLASSYSRSVLGASGTLCGDGEVVKRTPEEIVRKLRIFLGEARRGLGGFRADGDSPPESPSAVPVRPAPESGFPADMTPNNTTMKWLLQGEFQIDFAHEFD